MIRSNTWRGLATMRLKAHHCHDGQTIICSPTGDLDCFTRVEFARQVAELTRPNVHLVFNLSELGFFDVSGLRTLRDCAQRVRCRGGKASVSNPSAQLERLLELRGIDAVLPVSGETDGMVP
jgi:anti-anti-sigma factor